MADAKETRNKIVSFLKLKGPSLPVQIARETQISSLFAGAFLSELAREDAIRISNIKVGGSPLYYVKGHESRLGEFYKYLPEKEREAFLKLKQEKILEDAKQVPAIRVALRSIKDFAIPFKKDDFLFWRFHTTTEEEVRGVLEPKIPEKKEVKEPEITVKKEEAVKKEDEIKQEVVIKQKNRDIGLDTEKKENKKQEKFDNPLVIPEMQKEKEKPKSDFVSKIVERITSRYRLIDEKYSAAKEYRCVIQINSELGPINFLAFARDKKKLSETDLKKMLSEAQKIPLPALIMYKGELSKKALEYSVRYFSILKLEKI